MSLLGKLLKNFLVKSPSNSILTNALSLENKCVQSSFFTPAITNTIHVSKFSSLCARTLETRPLLALPPPANTTQIAGFKVKYALKRRCKDCYLVVRQARTYVLCKTHPRHKQMAPIKKAKYTWILTSASQSKIRPW